MAPMHRASESCGPTPHAKYRPKPEACGAPVPGGTCPPPFYQDKPVTEPPVPVCGFGRMDGPCGYEQEHRKRHKRHKRYHRHHHHHHHHHPCPTPKAPPCQPAYADCSGECKPCPALPAGCGMIDNIYWPDRGPCEPPPMLPCGEEKQPGYRLAPCTGGDQPNPPPCKEEKTLICKLPLSPLTQTLRCYERQPKECVSKTPELCGTVCSCYAPEYPTDRMIEDAARVRAYYEEENSWIRERIWPPPSSAPPLLITIPKQSPPPPPVHIHHHHVHPCLPLHWGQECPQFEECLLHHRGGDPPLPPRP